MFKSEKYYQLYLVSFTALTMTMCGITMYHAHLLLSRLDYDYLDTTLLASHNEY